MQSYDWLVENGFSVRVAMDSNKICVSAHRDAIDGNPSIHVSAQGSLGGAMEKAKEKARIIMSHTSEDQENSDPPESTLQEDLDSCGLRLSIKQVGGPRGPRYVAVATTSKDTYYTTLSDIEFKLESNPHKDMDAAQENLHAKLKNFVPGLMKSFGEHMREEERHRRA